MLRKLIIALSAAFLACTPAQAQTGSAKTPTVLNTEVNSLWADQNAGGITPFNARQTLLDIIASYANISGGTSLTTPVVAGTAAAARSLNVGSNFVAAQPAEFNINDNQAPADTRLGYFGVNALGAVNGAFVTASFGSDGHPVTTGSSPIVWAASFDATGAKNQYIGEYHHYRMVAGTGGGLGNGAFFVQCDLAAAWIPDNANAAGCAAANIASFTSVGGFVWGVVPVANCTGSAACNLVSAEFDTQYFSSSTSSSKVGVQIVDQGGASSVNPGTNASIALQILSTHSAWGWDTGILFPAAVGSVTDFPVRTTGTLIKSGAGTFAHGIDLSAGTCSTDCFKSNGYAVDGSGNITGANLVGTTTNNNAATGSVGEYVASVCGSSTATVTITIASPGVITWTGHGFTSACPVFFTTTGALPTGITASTTYWIVPSSITANTFQIATTVANALAGTSVNTSGSQSGTQTANSAPALTTGTNANITGISLTAGDWDVEAIGYFIGGGTTTVTDIAASMSTTTGTLDQTLDRIGIITPGGATAFSGGFGKSTVISPTSRFSLSGTTTVFMVVRADFGTSTASAYGMLRARRVR